MNHIIFTSIGRQKPLRAISSLMSRGLVTKIEKLSEIFDEIQGLLQEVVINKGGLAIPIETTPLMPIDI